MGRHTLDRRDFMKSAALVTGLVGAGHLPLLAAEAGNGSGIDADTGPGQVKTIRGYLSTHDLAEGPLPEAGPVRLKYDVIHWDWTPKNTDNSVPGQLEIVREAGAEGPRFTVSQAILYGGTRSKIDAEIACNADCYPTLREWRLRFSSEDHEGGSLPRLGFEEHGVAKDGKIAVKSANHTYGFAYGNPLVSQWTVLEHVARHPLADGAAPFDLLQDCSLHKMDQRLAYDGVVEVPILDGKRVSLHSYRQTGVGVLPVHYLVDEARRPQLVTNHIMSWALREVG